MDNHSLSRQKDEGHRGHAATDQRYGEKTRYHAVRRASLRTPSRPSKRSSMSEEWARNEQLRLRVDFDFLTYFKQINLL